MNIRHLLGRCTPAFVRRWLTRRRTARKIRVYTDPYRGLTPKEVFTRVYEDGAWQSTEAARSFDSGSGSHNEQTVGVYCDAIRDFTRRFAHPIDAADLGCGDFAVGSRITKYFRRYIACDVVPSLIARNRQQFMLPGVEFRALDITAEELPQATVGLLRQVLQHLSNDQIKTVLAKACSTYQFLIVTEHIPASPTFTANIDKPCGPDIRLSVSSGVILTAPPLSLKPLSQEVLCTAPEPDGITSFPGLIVTTAYRLRD